MRELKVFFDSNAVLAILEGAASAPLFSDLAALPHRALITDLVAVESVTVAWREGWEMLRQRIPFSLETDYEWITPEWRPWREVAASLARRYSPRIKIGTNDLLHLAAAELAGCDGFASLDARSGLRAIAHLRGLRVFPKLDALAVKDRPTIAALR